MKRISAIFVNFILCATLVVGNVPVQASEISKQPARQAPGSDNIYLPLVMNSYLPTIIPDTTKILEEVSSQDLASVSADGSVYTFSGTTPELQNVQVGDIMIGDVSPAAPFGFLRKVTAISPGGTQLNASAGTGVFSFATVAATIEQAFYQISIMSDVALTPEDIPIVNKVLYDDDGDLDTKNDQVVANGNIKFTPTLHLDLTIINSHIQNLTFSVKGQETANLTISSEVNLSEKKQFDFSPIILGAIATPIGPIVPELTFYVGVSGSLHAGVTTGITDTLSMTAGDKYDKGQWGKIESADNQFTYTPPVASVSLNAKGYVGAKLSLMVDGAAGPYAEIEAYLRLEANPLANPYWTLYGGLTGKAGVEISIFSIEIAKYETGLFNYEKVITWLGWAQVDSPTTQDLISIKMISPTDGWAVGLGGTILHWNGTVWSQVPSPVSTDLIDVAMVPGTNGTDGWIVGHNAVTLRWNGSAWSKFENGYTDDRPFVSVWMVSPTDGWISDQSWGRLIRWDGSQWSHVGYSSGSATSVVMNSATDGWAVGNYIVRWDGSNWNAVDDPNLNDPAFYFDVGITPGSNGTDGWIVGADGVMLRWDGSSWSNIPVVTSQYLLDLVVVSSSEAWVVGGGGTILSWDGISWININGPTTNNLTSMAMVSGSDGWAVGDHGTILHYRGLP